jgi:2-phospho-L-lactate transferase CofD
VMTKHGETDGFAASKFIQEINRYLGGEGSLDCAVLNYHESLPRDLYERYKSERSEPVSIDLGQCYESVRQLAIRPLTATGALVRHDPPKLAETLLSLLHEEAATPPPQLSGVTIA